MPALAEAEENTKSAANPKPLAPRQNNPCGAILPSSRKGFVIKYFLRIVAVLATACLSGGWTELQLCQRPIQPIHRPVQRPVNRHYHSSISISDSSNSDSDEKEGTNTVYKIVWADPGTLLLPPKVITVGNTLVFPDAKYGKIIRFTNTELTLLIKQEEVKYPFRLKN